MPTCPTRWARRAPSVESHGHDRDADPAARSRAHDPRELAAQPVRRSPRDAYLNEIAGASGYRLGGIHLRRREVEQLVVPGPARPHRGIGLRGTVDQHLFDAAQTRAVL